MLLKLTADYLEIERGKGKIYYVPLTLVGEKRNITVHATLVLITTLSQLISLPRNMPPILLDDVPLLTYGHL